MIGLITYFYTGYEYRPTQEVAESTRTGAATNIIYGLALGYQSTIVPIFTLAVIVFVAFTNAGMYGVALAALGMLSTLSICLSIDVYGPITDNAGGIAEMAQMPESVRNKTDVFDAAGNTTAAIGKGFAIGSAALVSLALFGAFVTRSELASTELLHPITFSGLLVGAMLPYWFSAMTMKSVGVAAMEMVNTVRNQFVKHKQNLFYVDETTGAILRHDDGSAKLREQYDDEGQKDPLFRNPLDLEGYYAEPVRVSTDASLKMMIAPGALVMFSPIIFGFLFGVNGVVGLLAGSLVSGVQMAISSSNTGGAWDNAKKYVEKGMLALNASNDPVNSLEYPEFVQKKGGECHKAAVIGDTVGDPLKDTSGPALNILMKLMAIISLVFAPFITQHSICATLHTC